MTRSRPKRTFFNTLRESLAELSLQFTAILALGAAVVAGVYFQSWVVFVATLVVGMVVMGAVHKAIEGPKQER